MKSSRFIQACKFILATTLFLYPFIVYFLLDWIGPAVLGLLLLALLAVRIKLFDLRAPQLTWIFLVIVGFILCTTLLAGRSLALRLYPTLISVGLFAAFAYTLWKPPSMIERITRSLGVRMSSHAGTYTRVVTILWCIFFAFNVLITALIGVAGSMKVWAFYNGFIAYVLVAVLLLGEYVFRIFYKRYHGVSRQVQNP